MFARLSRSASACRAIARFMLSGNWMSLSSTRATSIPQISLRRGSNGEQRTPFRFPEGARGGQRGPAHQRQEAEQQANPDSERHAACDEPDQPRIPRGRRSGHVGARGVDPDRYRAACMKPPRRRDEAGAR